MFGTIAGVLKDESEAFSNQLSELAAHIQASLAELAKMAARFDTEGDWGAGGYRSCADFLSVRAGLNLRTGSELLRVGHAMERLPKLAEVFSAGEISFDKARAVASVATRPTSTCGSSSPDRLDRAVLALGARVPAGS